MDEGDNQRGEVIRIPRHELPHDPFDVVINPPAFDQELEIEFVKSVEPALGKYSIFDMRYVPKRTGDG